MDLKIYPSLLRGTVVVPSSKSITHRYLICAALSTGKSIIEKPLICDDTLATISVLEKFGAKFKFARDKIIVKGCGIPKYKDRNLTILESATTLRVLLPLLVLFCSRIYISSSKRLIDRIYTSDLFDLKGLHFQRKSNIISIEGKLIEKEIVLSGKITSQLISGVLLVLPYLEEGTTLVIKDTTFDNPYLQLTLDAMSKFNIKYIIENDRISIEGRQKYTACNVSVEGDYSNGAVWLAASYFHKDLKVAGLKEDSLQGDRMFFDYMKALGVNYVNNEGIFSYASGLLNSGTIDVNETPDLAPILVSLASKGTGTIIIKGTRKLKYKESNRKLVIMDVVNLLGGNVKVGEDELIIQGKEALQGGVEVYSYNDHRIVMAVSILATICENPIIITDFQAVKKSYPDFFTVLANLGARIEVL
jgi:3-phosphoshikimate 1-carboxyvinyltransferase